MRLALAALLLLLATTGCGAGDDTDKDDPTSDTPACSSVWQVGETLPADYADCMDGDTIMAGSYYDCEDGGEFTTHDDRLYARLGGEIHEVSGAMSDDPTYRAFFDECHGL